MLITSGARFKRRSNPVLPSYVAGSVLQVASGTSGSLTIPATAQVDDYAIAVSTVNPLNGRIINPPTNGGWTELRRIQNSSLGTGIWYKKIVSGDIGLSQTWTQTGVASAFVIALAVYRNVGGFSVWPTRWERNPTGNVPFNIPAEMYRPSADLMVAYVSANSILSIATSAADVTSVPPGLTTRVAGKAGGGAAAPYSTTIFDGQPTLLTTVQGNTSAPCRYISGALVFHAKTEPPTNLYPASLIGQPLYAYGESYTCIADNGIGITAIPNAWAIWVDRLRQTQKPNTFNNLGIVGSEAQVACSFAYGTFLYDTGANSGSENAVNQAGTWYSQTNRSGLVLLELLGNDALRSTTENLTQRTNGATHATHALIKLIRSSAKHEETHSSVTSTGTWTSVSDDSMSGGSSVYSTTTGDKITITTSEQNIDVVLLAIDDSAHAAAGADFEIKVDGVLRHSGTTSNQMVSPGTINIKSFGHMVVSLTNMGTGSHTVEIIRSGGAADARLYFTSYLVPSATPPWIQLSAPAPGILDPQYDDMLLYYGDLAKTIAESYADGKVIFYSGKDQGRWVKANIFSPEDTNDGVHMNETGNAIYAWEMMQNLKARIP